MFFVEEEDEFLYEELDKKSEKNIKETIEEEGINFSRYLKYLIIFIVLSGLTFFYIYKTFGKPGRILIIKEFSPLIIIQLLILLFIYFTLDGLRLYTVIRTLDCKIKFRYIYQLVFINLFVSNITPFATGGGVVQIYFLNQKGISLGDATASTTIRTVLATFIIFIATPIIIFNRSSFETILPQSSLLVYLTFFAALYIVFFYIIIFRDRFLKKIVYNVIYFVYDRNFISKKKFRKTIRYIFRELDSFQASLSDFLKKDFKKITITIVSTILFLLSELSFSYLLITGLGYEVNYLNIILMQVVVIFVMYFAPTPGATGVAEGGYSLVFARFVSTSDMLPLILAWRLFTKYIGIVIGFVLLFVNLIRED